LSPIMEDLGKLTVHYTISRHPDAANSAPSKIYTRKTAEELVECARRALEWVERNLRS
jgi:HEPN domain-containing protein